MSAAIGNGTRGRCPDDGATFELARSHAKHGTLQRHENTQADRKKEFSSSLPQHGKEWEGERRPSHVRRIRGLCWKRAWIRIERIAAQDMIVMMVPPGSNRAIFVQS